MLRVLLIEFLDEFIFGVRESAWPQIRSNLQLTYAQIGMLLGLPGIASSLIEPFLGILSDRGKRRALILGGGILFALSLLMTGVSHTFPVLLLSFMLFYPASGAFVSLSQTAMMDREPEKKEKNMAKWSFAGSLGVVIGPLVLTVVLLGGGNWQSLFILTALLTVALLGLVWRLPVMQSHHGSKVPFSDSVRGVFYALMNVKVLRWLMLLAFSDMMLDVLLGYLTLYFVDIAVVSQSQASIAVGVWAVVGLMGDFVLIRLLDRVSGLTYLRWSAVIELLLFPLFLLAPDYWMKILLLACLGLFNAGWYSILKAQLYGALPEKSGVVLAVSNIFGLLGAAIPWIVGLIADRYGLRYAMWLLLLGPIGLAAGLPRRREFATDSGLIAKIE